jgi:hypothetical protein
MKCHEAILAAALAAISLAGCSVGPKYKPPAVQPPSGYKETGNWNLAAVRILEQEAGVQAKAVEAARRSLALSNTRYEGGVTNYLEVITAENAALSDEVTAVNILGRRMASAVLLIEAMGGGWDRSALPQRPECCGKLVSENAAHN